MWTPECLIKYNEVQNYLLPLYALNVDFFRIGSDANENMCKSKIIKIKNQTMINTYTNAYSLFN